MENRDLFFDKEEKKENKRGIWLILIYILLLIGFIFGVVITSANFLKATIKDNEIIIEPGTDIDDDKEPIQNDEIDNQYENNYNKNNNSTNVENHEEEDNSKLKVTFTEQEDVKIRLRYAYPVSEEKAKQENNLAKFNVKNISGDAYYRISLEDIDDNELSQKYNNKKIDHKYLRYYLKDLTNNIEYTGTLSDLDNKNSFICEVYIDKNDIIEYSMAIWIDEDTGNDTQNSYYIGKLVIDVWEA